MASVVDIYNLALYRIGNSATVASTSDQSAEARACNAFYEQSRDFMLRDYPWNFARRRVNLSLTTDPAPTNWQYVYAYPSDCLRFMGLVVPGTRTPIIRQEIPFEVMSNGTTRVIYCDIQNPEAEYTARITDPSQFDPLFVSALAYFLAAEICMPLAVSPQVQDTLRKAYGQIVMSAAAADMRESFLGPEPDGELLQVRHQNTLYPGSVGPWSAYPGGFFIG